MRVLGLTSALVLSAIMPAVAAEKEVYFQKADASGRVLLISDVYDVNADCSSLGTIVVKVLQAPSHGKFSSRAMQVFAVYGPGSPVAHCNGRRVSGRENTYISKPGYTGPDYAEFEVIFPTGEVNHVHVDITVM